MKARCALFSIVGLGLVWGLGWAGGALRQEVGGAELWRGWTLVPGQTAVDDEGRLAVLQWPEDAQVILRSPLVPLESGGGPLRLQWAAELPEGTRLQVRSRSGDTLDEQLSFFDRTGNAVTERRWFSIPKVLRGQVDTVLSAGADWDGWSAPYGGSGEEWRSAPGRFVQLELVLSSDDPRARPAVQAVALELLPPTAVESQSWGAVKAADR